MPKIQLKSGTIFVYGHKKLYSKYFEVKTLLLKWGAIHKLKSLWNLKSEITSLHFTDFTLVKVISL
jgi:hypothetical protein